CHSDAAATKHCPGKGDLGDADAGCRGLTMTSTHTPRKFLSLDAYEVSCRVRVGEATRPARPLSRADAGFTPRSRTRLQSGLSGPVGPPSPSTCGLSLGLLD